MQPSGYDVFISYAREDSEWVRTNLYERLLQFRTESGAPPRIFFDVEEHGVRIGRSFMSAIAEAIHSASKIVLCYSSPYFRKEMTTYELEHALSRDVNGKKGILLPLLLDPAAAGEIPVTAQLINYWACTLPGWFDRLTRALALTPAGEPLELAFVSEPGDVFVNHTLPVVRVAVRSAGKVVPVSEAISLESEAGDLQGSLRVQTENGTALFDDLSLGEPVESTRLIASSPTTGKVFSRPFRVHQTGGTWNRVSHEAAPSSRILGAGEAVFYDEGKALAFVQDRQVLLFDAQGKPMMPGGPVPLRSRVRFLRSSPGALIIADWLGNVTRVGSDGRYTTWSFGKADGGFIVPADADLCGADLHVGFWSGNVFRIAPDGPPEMVLRDDSGVQALGAVGGRIFTCDFDGNLRVYRDGRLVNSGRLEPTVWLLKATGNCLLAVGDRRFYHITPESLRIISFEMPIADVASVSEDSAMPVVIDSQGKGIRFDADLLVRATFHTRPGARPTSADDGGEYCVFRNPDGSRTLMVRDRIVYCQPQGTLAVSPDASRFAVGDGSELQVLTREEFAPLLEQS